MKEKKHKTCPVCGGPAIIESISNLMFATCSDSECKIHDWTRKFCSSEKRAWEDWDRNVSEKIVVRAQIIGGKL